VFVGYPAGVADAGLWDVNVRGLPASWFHGPGVSGRLLERVAVVGESPVRENIWRGSVCVPE
jgi:hypothetical protein